MAANMGSQQPLQQPQLQQIQQQQQIQQPQSQLPQQSQLQSQSQTQPQSQQQVSTSPQTQQQTPPQQQQQQQQQQLQLQQQQKSLVVAVEGTAALGPSWALLKSEYVEKIVRAFCAADPTGQRPVATGEMSLVVFYSHGHSDCLLQRSGWTSNLDTFLQWLSAIEFVGGGFGEVAIAEGLTQVLMMCGPSLSTQSSIQGMERNRHCLLIAASDPHKLPTPVPNLLAGSTQQIGVPSGWCLADAEAVATSFSQNCVSLSVLSPRQLPSLKALYNGARRNGGAIETGADVLRHPQHLVLLSELFPEAKATLARNIVQHPVSQPAIVKLEQPPTQVAASSAVQSNSKATSGWQGMPPNGNLPMQNVKAEINQAPPISSAAAPSASLLGNAVPLSVQTAAVPIAGQEVTSMSTENTSSQDYKLLQPLRSVGNSITSTNILTNAQGNPGMRQTINSSNLAGGAPLGIQTTTSSQTSLHGNLLSASNPMAIAKNALGLTQQGIGMPMSTNSMGLSGAAMGQGAGAVSIGQGGLAASMGQLPMDNGHTGLVSATTSLVTTTNLGAVSQQASGLAGIQNVGGLGQPITAMGQGISHVTHTATGVPPGLGAVHGGLASVNSNSGTMIPTPGLAQQVPSQSGAAPLHMPSAVTPPQQPVGQSAGRYTKLWEGILAGQRQGRPVHICKLEGYRQTSSPDNLAADWPSTMQIVRLIAQDYMSSKEYQGKAELLVFRPTSQHGFLSQLAEKKLCAVIQLPSQTLLLASAINGDKPNRMIGMLFPGDMVVFKPQAASQAAVPTGAQSLAAAQTFVPQGQLAVQPGVPGQVRPMMPNTPPLPSGAFLP